MTSSLRNFSWSLGHPTLGMNLREFKGAGINLNLNYAIIIRLNDSFCQIAAFSSAIQVTFAM